MLQDVHKVLLNFIDRLLHREVTTSSIRTSSAGRPGVSSSWCRQTHLPRTTCSHAQLLHRLVVRVYSHTLTSMHLHGSSHEAHCLRFAKKHSHLILVAQCRTRCRTGHHSTGTPFSPSSETVFQQSEQPCGDQRPQQSDALTDLPPLTRGEAVQDGTAATCISWADQEPWKVARSGWELGRRPIPTLRRCGPRGGRSSLG